MRINALGLLLMAGGAALFLMGITGSYKDVFANWGLPFGPKHVREGKDPPPP